jgi:hypothetical protein
MLGGGAAVQFNCLLLNALGESGRLLAWLVKANGARHGCEALTEFYFREEGVCQQLVSQFPNQLCSSRLQARVLLSVGPTTFHPSQSGRSWLRALVTG